MDQVVPQFSIAGHNQVKMSGNRKLPDIFNKKNSIQTCSNLALPG